MYWDVVEVKPESGYCLFVRFQDGLSGRVRFRREELTGVLAPLSDPGFFEQVFIGQCAIAWPGEIALLPTRCTRTSPVSGAICPQTRFGPGPEFVGNSGAWACR